MKILKSSICLLLVWAILFSGGCGKWKNAVDATARLSRQIENLVDKNEQAYNEGVYDRETALKIAGVLKEKAIPLTKAFNQAVKDLSAKYSDRKDIPAPAFKNLREDFFAVEAAVREVLITLGALNKEQSLIFQGIIAGIKEALALIGDAFSVGEIYIGGRQKWQIS